MQLLVLHPEVPDCESCLKWHYNDEWQRTKFRGEWIERRPDQPPRCRTEQGCPRGTPERQNTLSPKNLAAYRHYRKCRAIGRFPDDPLVEEHAEIIRSIEEQAEELRQFQALGLAQLKGAAGA